MRLFLFLASLAVMAGSIFAVQNSTASPVMMKFLFWRFETSLVYCILGSMGLGMLVVILLWIPRAIRGSFSTRTLKRENQNLKRELNDRRIEPNPRSNPET